MAENPTSSSTIYTTLGAPSGALGGSNGVQSGTESRISTLIVPLNGSLIPRPSVRRLMHPAGGTSVPCDCWAGHHPAEVTSAEVRSCYLSASGMSQLNRTDGEAHDRGADGPGSACSRPPAANAAGGRRRRDRLLCTPDLSARAAQALGPGPSRRPGRVADRFEAANRGGDRTEPGPVRRHRFLVVHRGGTGPDRRTRRPFFRDRVPGQRVFVRRHAFRGRGGRSE